MRGQTKEHTHLASRRQNCHLNFAKQDPSRVPGRAAFMDVTLQVIPWTLNPSSRDCVKYSLGGLGDSVGPFLYVFKIDLSFMFPTSSLF